MNKTIKTEEVEKIFNKYIGAYFDAIQDILEEKSTSNDINLDIKMKIFAKVHQTLVEVKKELFVKSEGEE